METDWFIEVIILLCLLFFSAFFSGSEVALFSLDKKKVKRSFSGYPLISKYLNELISKPRRLLVTILVGNTVVNVAASIIAVLLAIKYSNFSKINIEIVITVQIVLLTVIILTFGEITPKVIASKNPARFAKFAAFPLYWINAVLFPVSELISELIKAISSKVKIDKTKAVITKDELTELTEVSHEQGAIEEEEHEIITSLVEFKSVLVGEIMTPRVDINAVPINSSFDDVINKIKNTGHSRVPVYKDDLDNITGIIYAKDLLPFMKDEKLRADLNLSKIARKAIFAPKTKRISDMLYEFQEKKMHIAIVVDEYGGTEGLVTLEDIIEEVVGEIWDEYDKEESAVKEIAENKFIVLGKAAIDELNEAIGEQVLQENEAYETVGGFILNNAGEIPVAGYQFEENGYVFTVKEIANKRIKRVSVEKIKK